MIGASSPGAQPLRSSDWRGEGLQAGKRNEGRRPPDPSRGARGTAEAEGPGKGRLAPGEPGPAAAPAGPPEWSAAVRASGRGAVLELEARPGSSAPGELSYDPWRGRLRLTLSERAEGGRANAELLQRLSSALGVPAATLSILSGERARRKSVLVEGLEAGEAIRRIAPRLREGGCSGGALSGRRRGEGGTSRERGEGS